MSRVIPCGMVYNMILKCSKARSGKVDRKIRDKYKSIIKQTTQIYTPEHNKNCLFKNVVDIDFNDAYCGVLRTFPCPYSLPASKPYENMDNVKIYLIKYTNLKTNDS
jgi:Ca2+-dependent lipid-binding protein